MIKKLLFKFRGSILFLFLFYAIEGMGQNHGTCDNAAVVTALTIESFDSISPGSQPDITLTNPHKVGKFFHRDYCVYWLKFTAAKDGPLTFDLVPDNHSDDLDFILFRDDNGDFCKNEKAGNIDPIRTNMAKVNGENFGATGLSLTAKVEFVKSGINPNYSKYVWAHKGQTFYLAVANYTNPHGAFGLTLSLQNKSKRPKKNYVAPLPDNSQEEDNTPPARAHKRKHANTDTAEAPPSNNPPDNIPVAHTHTDTVAAPPASVPPNSRIDAAPYNAPALSPSGAARYKLIVKLLDSASGNPVNGKITVNEVYSDSNVKVDSASGTVFLVPGQNVRINCNAPDYGFVQQVYAVPFKGNDTVIDINIPKTIKFEEFVLKYIYFFGNSDRFMPVSTSSLVMLNRFMQYNPNISILIKGFVNDALHQETKKYDMDLSVKRANAVKKYLISKGISEDRLEAKGYGTEMLIYEHPKNAAQEQANRRVEIQVK
jgi:outer membrane protein OmpA-like peptidoglycan-associated protein